MRDLARPGRVALAAAAFGLLLALGLTTSASATHPRLGGGTPLRVPLAPAFIPCVPGAVTAGHGLPPGAPSCGPPVLESPLTSGAAGAAAGFVRLDVGCVPPPVQPLPCTTAAGDQEDITVAGTITDITCTAPGLGCPAAGADYAGPVSLNMDLRFTDHANAPGMVPCAAGGGGPPCVTATQFDITMGFMSPCAPVGAAGAPPGSTCMWATSFDAVAPGIVTEFQRETIRFTDEITVLHPGPDGTFACPPPAPAPVCVGPGGSGDETVVRAESVFAP